MGKNISTRALKRRGKQGFAGFTVPALKGGREDISRIKHDVRNELVVVREGISQVLDGLGAKDCGKCCNILKPALKHADRLYEIIDELFNVPTHKTKLKDKKNSVVFDDFKDYDFRKIKNEYRDRLAHLLRTPLNIANESLALVVDGVMGELNPKQRDMIALLKKNMVRLNKSIEHILSTHGKVT